MPCPGANTPWLTARYTPPPTRATSIAPLVFRKLRRFKVIDCRSLQGGREESPVPIQGVLGLLCNYLGWRSFSAHTHFSYYHPDHSTGRSPLFPPGGPPGGRRQFPIPVGAEADLAVGFAIAIF